MARTTGRAETALAPMLISGGPDVLRPIAAVEEDRVASSADLDELCRSIHLELHLGWNKARHGDPYAI